MLCFFSSFFVMEDCFPSPLSHLLSILMRIKKRRKKLKKNTQLLIHNYHYKTLPVSSCSILLHFNLSFNSLLVALFSSLFLIKCLSLNFLSVFSFTDTDIFRCSLFCLRFERTAKRKVKI